MSVQLVAEEGSNELGDDPQAAVGVVLPPAKRRT